MIKWVMMKLFHYVVGDLTPEEQSTMMDAISKVAEAGAKGAVEGGIDGIKK